MQCDQTITCPKTFSTKYENLRVVIIDQSSMVCNSLLSFIDQRLQELQDLYSMKPITDNRVFNDIIKDSDAFWKDHVTLFELTETRKKDDLKFA